MNKNIGPFLAFDESWFNKHQRLLLKLLNNSKYARWEMGISDKEHLGRIVKVGPDRVTYADPTYFKLHSLPKKIQLTTDFRTHPKYSKRLYYSLKPLWWAMHGWDKPADVLFPKLSFGLDVLTAYPDPNPETTSVDGYVGRSGQDAVWSTLISGVGDDGIDTSTDAAIISMQGSATLNQYSRIVRSIYLVDTSSIGDPDTIDSGTFSLFGTDKADALIATPDINIYASTPATNTALVAADFGQTGSTTYATAITYANWSTSAYNDFTLNATGLSNVSKTSVTKLSARNANYDVANSAPPWVISSISRLNGYFADQAGTTNDPKLVINYTVVTATLKGLGLLGVGN